MAKAKLFLKLLVVSILLLVLQTTVVVKTKNLTMNLIQIVERRQPSLTQEETLTTLKETDTGLINPQTPEKDPHKAIQAAKPSSNQGNRLEPMVMGLDYREQTANALANLFDLQCWARSVGLGKVVEPSVKALTRSIFHFLPGDDRALKFRDLFNMTHWNQVSMKHGFSPLVTTEHFVSHAVRDVVFVQILYRLHRTYCLHDYAMVRKPWYKFLTKKGFRIIKTVCIDFTRVPTRTMTEQSFRETIFQDTGHDVSVLFNVWEGIRANNDFRVALRGSRCSDLLYQIANVALSASKPARASTGPNSSSSSPIMPSQRISKLVHGFLLDPEMVNGERFVAIMMRTEKLKHETLSDMSCVTAILADWKRLAKTNNITKTLFFSDADSHGSITLHTSLEGTYAKFLRNSLQLELTTGKVNAYLEKITGSKDSVLIAVLTRQIVAHARCVIMIGGGLFQRQALNMFAHNHKEQELCYSIRNSACDPEYISQVYDSDHLRAG